MNEPSKWAVKAMDRINQAAEDPDASYTVFGQQAIQWATDQATTELVKERDELKEHVEIFCRQIDCAPGESLVEAARKWVNSTHHVHGTWAQMEKSAKAMAATILTQQERITAMTALLDRMEHAEFMPFDGKKNCLSACPACAWDKMKKEVEK